MRKCRSLNKGDRRQRRVICLCFVEPKLKHVFHFRYLLFYFLTGEQTHHQVRSVTASSEISSSWRWVASYASANQFFSRKNQSTRPTPNPQAAPCTASTAPTMTATPRSRLV